MEIKPVLLPFSDKGVSNNYFMRKYCVKTYHILLEEILSLLPLLFPLLKIWGQDHNHLHKKIFSFHSRIA